MAAVSFLARPNVVTPSAMVGTSSPNTGLVPSPTNVSFTTSMVRLLTPVTGDVVRDPTDGDIPQRDQAPHSLPLSPPHARARQHTLRPQCVLDLTRFDV
eukprot:m.30202 g.30202  ORF g.30202 m.30202 type:complete len:99 (+) comp12203_c0_seq1:2600-2896(+)